MIYLYLKKINCELEKWSSRQPHKLETDGSNPSLATINKEKIL